MNPDSNPREISDFTRKKLTRFLCQELLYEYVTHRLDVHREQEINEFISTCRETTRELENLNKGLRYTQVAAQVQVSPKLQAALANFEPQWKKRFREWTLWSSQRGWKALPYLFVTLALGLGVLATKPWIKTLNEDVMLAEQLKKEPDLIPAPATAPKPVVAAVAKAPEPAAPAPVPDEADEPPKAVAPSSPPPLLMAPAKPLAVAPPAPVPIPVPVPVVSQTQPKPNPQPQPAPLAVPAETPIADVQNAKPGMNGEQMGRGILYRAEIEVSDFHNSWPAIRDKVVALGGKVAGNVELGWLRKPSESYFHFSLPESNYNELEIFLGTFSPVRFSKDRHPRVMPEGQIRIILTVKDGMTSNEGASETP